MRIVSLLPALAAASLMLSAPAAKAEITYPWCAQYGEDGGGRNCGFATIEQCRAALSGNGGYCEQNAMYRPETTGSVTPLAPARRPPAPRSPGDTR
jgi:uncharacterized protein DUF3551